MKIKAIYKRIVFLFAAAFLSLFCLFESVFSIKAFADEQVKYDRTKIEYDLSDMNLLEYEFKTDVEVIRFQEYCYAPNGASDNYGLYLYVFNPTGTAFVQTDENLVNMAVAYNDEGQPSAYENLKLMYLDETDDGRFIKYKVSDSKRLYKVANDYEEDFEKRRYDVVGFEFTQKDGGKFVTKQEEVGISKTYYYTGYSASGDNNVSTLKCEVQKLETIELDVQHTNYLMENYGLNGEEDFNICDNLHTVYFSVPERYFTEYGDLQKIAAEWYEYKTSPIFVTSDDEAYEAFKPYLGQTLINDDGEPLGKDLYWRVFWDYYVRREYIEIGLVPVGYYDIYYYYWRFNSLYMDNDEWGETFRYASGAQNIDRMSWLLLRDTDSTNREEYWVSSKELLTYAQWYSENYSNGNSLILDKYSTDLFSTFGNELNAIDEDRQKNLVDFENGATSGRVNLEINAEDKQNLVDMGKISYISDIIGALKGETNTEIDCIKVLSAADKTDIVSLGPESFAEKYYVNKHEAKDIQDYCVKEIENGNRVVFFRFAVTDYYSANARFDEIDKAMSSEDGFVSQQTVFLNFGVISLTFRNELQKDTVIGVVANPIDIFSSIEPGEDMREVNRLDFDLNLAIGLILGGLALAIFAPFLAPLLGQVFNLLGSAIVWIFNALLTVIALPFKLIGKLFDKMFHKKE